MTTPRILIVDDQQLNQLLLTRILEKLGHAADVAASGFEAIEMIAHRPYDLVFMDVQMPALDGRQTARHIRAQHPHAIRIVGVSADASTETRQACIQAGMNDYLPKPFTIEQIRDVLDHLGPPRT